jgi:hypothetical protein
VEYENENEAEDAMAALKDKEFGGLPINIGKSKMEQIIKAIRCLHFN